MKRDTPYRIARTEWEKAYLTAAMDEHGWIVPRASEATGIGRTQMYRLLERHGIRVPIPRNQGKP